jgi:1A family penicillin-binding protein
MEIMTDQRFKRTIKYLRALLFISLIFISLILISYLALLIYAKALGPPPLAVPQSTLYYSEEGKIIGESNSGQKRYWISLDDIAPELVEATIAIEDRGFFDHHGFDFKRIAGAAFADLKAMSKVQGASTISQQYARNLFLEHEKTWKRKLLEAFYTMRIEMNYSKSEILEGYLNTIYFGEGAYGVQAASQFYFNKNASELSLAEAAMLAGIPKGPSIYSPLVSYENAKKRQKIILQAMVNNHSITKEEGTAAEKENIRIVGKHLNTKVSLAPYFQDAVRQELRNLLSIDEKTIELGGLKVYTTLNLKQQTLAEKNIEKYISKESDIQVGMVAINPKNGYVKAMVGGRSYEKSPFNRATQAVRQPGSTLKPILYYAAIENGFTPATTMRSELTTFRFQDHRLEYTPHNFNDKYANGEITMTQALALSDNVYAVKTHLFLGEETLVDTIKKFGITTKMEGVPSLALGTSGVRLIEMANAYSLFANEGKEVAPVFIKRIEDHNGDIIYENKPVEDQVLRPDVAFVTTHMMTGMFDRKLNGYSSVTGSTIINQMTRMYAGKSGSTNSDSWMIGFTPQLVTAVWTGYDQGEPIENSAEKTYAKNIWIHFMEDALKGKPLKTFKPPKGTIGVPIDPENGKLSTKDCPVQRLTYFVAGTEPTDYCTDHILEKPDGAKKKKATSPSEGKKAKLPWYKKLFEWAP